MKILLFASLTMALMGCMAEEDQITGQDAMALMTEWQMEARYDDDVDDVDHPDLKINADLSLVLRVDEESTHGSYLCFAGELRILGWTAPEDAVAGMPNGCMDLPLFNAEPDFEKGTLDLSFRAEHEGEGVADIRARATKGAEGLMMGIINPASEFISFNLGGEDPGEHD